MENFFNQFKEQFKYKSLNEILGCAKFHCCGLSLVRDVDDYNNNQFAFAVRWRPNEKYNSNENIEVECLYSHLTGEAEFTLLNGEINKFDRTWKIVKHLDLNEESFGSLKWWKVLKMEDGVLWMNNCEGEMAFIENNGRILKTTF